MSLIMRSLNARMTVKQNWKEVWEEFCFQLPFRKSGQITILQKKIFIFKISRVTLV